jgi:hypothetical protein
MNEAVLLFAGIMGLASGLANGFGRVIMTFIIMFAFAFLYNRFRVEQTA